MVVVSITVQTPEECQPLARTRLAEASQTTNEYETDSDVQLVINSCHVYTHEEEHKKAL